MFEYRDDFLMSPRPVSEFWEDAKQFCFASNAAEGQLAELAMLVGSGSKLGSTDDAEQIELVESAPALEFDLEDELSKAFQSEPNTEAQRPDVFDAAALESALNRSIEATDPPRVTTPAEMPQLPASPLAAAEQSTDDPSMDFSDMIAEELDRALAEEVAADDTLVAQDTSRSPAMHDPDATIDGQADLELSRLLDPDASEQETEGAVETVPVLVAAPFPEVAVAPPQAAQVVEVPAVPDHNPVPSAPAAEFRLDPPQMSDYPSVEVDYSDPAAEFTEPKAIEPVADFDPAPAVDNAAHIDAVLDEAMKLETAAIQTSLPPAPQFEEVNAEFEKHYDQELQASLDAVVVEDQTAIVPPIPVFDGGSYKNRSGRRVAFALVAIALLGGTAALGWNYVAGDVDQAPTLLASTEPVKVKPENVGGKVVPNQDQAVYQSEESGNNAVSKQAQLTDKTETPISVASSPTGDKASARVAKTDQSTTGGLALKPRRVRTVVVRPDGTIVSASGIRTNTLDTSGVNVETPVLALKPQGLQNTLDAPVSVPVKVARDVSSDAPEAKVVKAVKVASLKTTPTSTKVTKVEANEVSTAKVKPAAVKPTPKAPAKTVVKPEVKKAAAKAVDESLPSVKSAYAVQISSQRSSAAAKQSYATLTRRYASILKGRGVDIRKAEVKGKGAYYRVRIPAESRGVANKICGQMKAKGGDCFVTR